MFSDREEIKELIKTKSKNENLWIVTEELAELQKEICKHQRKQYLRRPKLLEEIADVYICLEMLQELMNFSDMEVVEMVAQKMDRNLDRVGS